MLNDGRSLWLEKEDFFEGVTDWAGAATYLSKAKDADVTLFI